MHFMKALALLLLLLGAGSAVSYEFGSKVRSGDVDVGDTLLLVPLSPFYFETSRLPGLDPSDAAYLHNNTTGNVGIVLPGDIRITPFLGYISGSRVKAGDVDVTYPINWISGNWSWSELFSNNGICNIDEPVYFQQVPPITPHPLAVDDLRFSRIQGLNPGSWVKDSDTDFNNPALTLHARMMFHDQANTGYDDSDPVYLKIVPPFGPPANVAPGDLRLTALNGQN